MGSNRNSFQQRMFWSLFFFFLLLRDTWSSTIELLGRKAEYVNQQKVCPNYSSKWSPHSFTFNKCGKSGQPRGVGCCMAVAGVALEAESDIWVTDARLYTTSTPSSLWKPRARNTDFNYLGVQMVPRKGQIIHQVNYQLSPAGSPRGLKITS